MKVEDLEDLKNEFITARENNTTYYFGDNDQFSFDGSTSFLNLKEQNYKIEEELSHEDLSKITAALNGNQPGGKNISIEELRNLIEQVSAIDLKKDSTNTSDVLTKLEYNSKQPPPWEALSITEEQFKILQNKKRSNSMSDESEEQVLTPTKSTFSASDAANDGDNDDDCEGKIKPL